MRTFAESAPTTVEVLDPLALLDPSPGYDALGRSLDEISFARPGMSQRHPSTPRADYGEHGWQWATCFSNAFHPLRGSFATTSKHKDGLYRYPWDAPDATVDQRLRRLWDPYYGFDALLPLDAAEHPRVSLRDHKPYLLTHPSVQ